VIIFRLEFYGVEFFRARDQHGVELGLGITCNGVSVYKGRTHIITFAWYVVIIVVVVVVVVALFMYIGQYRNRWFYNNM